MHTHTHTTLSACTALNVTAPLPSDEQHTLQAPSIPLQIDSQRFAQAQQPAPCRSHAPAAPGGRLRLCTYRDDSAPSPPPTAPPLLLHSPEAQFLQGGEVLQAAGERRSAVVADLVPAAARRRVSAERAECGEVDLGTNKARAERSEKWVGTMDELQPSESIPGAFERRDRYPSQSQAPPSILAQKERQ
jgi:hypothetical protein